MGRSKEILRFHLVARHRISRRLLRGGHGIRLSGDYWMVMSDLEIFLESLDSLIDAEHVQMLFRKCFGDLASLFLFCFRGSPSHVTTRNNLISRVPDSRSFITDHGDGVNVPVLISEEFRLARYPW